MIDRAGDVIACGVVTFGYQPEFLTVVKLSGKDGSLTWQRIIGGSINWRASSCCSALSVDQQNNVIVGGTVTVITYETTQFVLEKLAGDTGQTIWKRWLGDLEPRVSSGLGYLTIDPFGDLLASGSIQAEGYGSTTIKFDGRTGEEIWRLSSDRGDSFLGWGPFGLDPGGDVFMFGSEYISRSYRGLLLERRSGVDGREVWRFNQLRPQSSGRDLSVDSRADVLLAGGSSLMKFSGATGAVQWARPIAAVSVSVDRSGDAIATLAGGEGVARLRGSDGEIIWQRIGDPSLSLWDIALDPEGDVGATGVLRNPEADSLALMKLDGITGLTRWRRTFGDDLAAVGWVVEADSARDIIAAGKLTGISTDAWGEQYVDSKAVVVKVWGRTGADFPPTPSQLLSALEDTIVALTLPRSLEYSLLRQVTAATAWLSDADPSNDSKAAESLRLLIRRVTAQRGKSIPTAGADEIMSLVAQTIVALGAPE